MENKEPKKEVIDQSVFNPKYIVAKLEGTNMDFADKNVYLYKNGKACICPHLQIQGSSGHACGTMCHHFNIIKEKDKDKLTGRVFARITCGGTVHIPIDNLKSEPSSQIKTP